MRLVVPAVPEGETFEWVIAPDGDIPEDAIWFIDGSLFDEKNRFGRRTGFGIVVVSSAGSLLALGRGVPPAWVLDAAGAEVSALFSAIRLSHCMPHVVTDCLGLLNSLQDGYMAGVGSNRRQARLWVMIGHALDEDFSSAARMVVWMPSHDAAHTINVVKDSSGSLLTPVMWRANRLADLLAKSAAEPLRLPRRIAKYVAVMSKLVAHHCARLGVATRRANAHHVVVQDEEGVERIMILRDETASSKTKSSGCCADQAAGPSKCFVADALAPRDHGCQMLRGRAAQWSQPQEAEEPSAEAASNKESEAASRRGHSPACA